MRKAWRMHLHKALMMLWMHGWICICYALSPMMHRLECTERGFLAECRSMGKMLSCMCWYQTIT